MLRFIITYVCDLMLRVFFRRIEMTGRERVPRAGGVIFVVNHPNALVDPLFLLCRANRPVSFLAKSTLLKMPVVGWLARALDTLPVYRRQDAGEQTARNSDTFRLCRELLARGGCIAICPEGVSHNEPRLLPIKTGAARIALGAAAGDSDDASNDIHIVPVGIYYTAKTVFRSEALLHFGAPLHVPRLALDSDGEPPRAAVARFSAEIETALRSLVINADSDETLRRVAEAERIWSSEIDDANTANEDACLRREAELRRRILDGYDFLSQDEARPVVDELARRVERCDRLLRTAAVDPRDVTTIERAPDVLLRRIAKQLLVIIPLLPLATLGAVAHYPAYRLVGFCADHFARGSDDMIATLKMLLAALLFPLTWLLVALGVWMISANLPAASLAFVCAPVAGYVALRFLETEARLGEGLRALRLAYKDRSFFAELVAERRRIRNLLAELADELPDAA